MLIALSLNLQCYISVYASNENKTSTTEQSDLENTTEAIDEINNIFYSKTRIV